MSELQQYTLGLHGLPSVDADFGFERVGQEWVPINWRHKTLSSQGIPFGVVIAGCSVPFYFREKYAYPIMEDAAEDFYRAGFVGVMKRKENASFNDFYNAIAANADAIWLPGNLWDEIKTSIERRNNFKHWLVESANTQTILRGYIARLGRTRIYTDAFANSWAEQFLNDGMYVLKVHADVDRRADSLDQHRVCIVDGRKGKKLMMEKDVSARTMGLFDLLDRCHPPTHVRSNEFWINLPQE